MLANFTERQAVFLTFLIGGFSFYYYYYTDTMHSQRLFSSYGLVYAFNMLSTLYRPLFANVVCDIYFPNVMFEYIYVGELFYS